MIISIVTACALASYLITLFLSFLARGGRTGLLLATVGTACMGTVVSFRYVEAWPMQPMYLGLPALTFCLGCIRIALQLWRPDSHSGQQQVVVDCILVLLTASSLFFPKDFYLPLIHSNTLWAHLCLLTGAAGKALLLVAASHALCCTGFLNGQKSCREGLSILLPWASWGYGLLTMSMFSGEMWSYQGWGMPVVWHDSAVAVAMTLWFYWTGVLHLHYLKHCSTGLRMALTSFGGFLIVFLGCYPEMGPWNPPGFLRI